MTCRACEDHKRNPLCGSYQMQCLVCCTRLVLSAHPSKLQASAMLAAIQRFPESPGRARVLESVRHALAKRP